MSQGYSQRLDLSMGLQGRAASQQHQHGLLLSQPLSQQQLGASQVGLFNWRTARGMIAYLSQHTIN